MVVIGRKPWLAKFNGENAETYTLWRHQLQSLIEEGHPEKDIHDAVRASIHGKAGNVIVALGTNPSIHVILKKMDSVYGETENQADALSTFYSAQQGKTETVTDWGCRLEGLLQMVKRQTNIPGDPDEMLRTKFWNGLRQELKDLSVYQFDTIKNFDDLRMAMRRIEKNHTKPKTATHSAVLVDNEGEQKWQKLETSINQLNSAFQKLSAKVDDATQGQRPHQPVQLGDFNRQNTTQSRGGASFNTRRRGYHGSSRGRGQQNTGEIICYNCGEKNHIAVHCRARVDHLRHQDFSDGLGLRGKHETISASSPNQSNVKR